MATATMVTHRVVVAAEMAMATAVAGQATAAAGKATAGKVTMPAAAAEKECCTAGSPRIPDLCMSRSTA